MLKAILNLLEKTKNIKKSAYTWNALNAIISAAQSPIILMVMTRTNGVYDAGIFSIAFAIANLMLYMGLYGLRRFQSSDINEKYSFGEYHGMRILSCSMMLFISVIYGFYAVCFNGYDGEKFTVVLLCCVVKCVQAYSDVYHGCMQQKGRLDVATKCSSMRYAAEMIIYCLFLIVTGNLVVSTIAFAITSVVFLLITSVNAGKNYGYYRPEFHKTQIRSLIVEGFPLFASLFLNAYISNAPKYAIDAYLTEEIQAIYNMIFMPAFVVMIVANFIFNPILTTYAELWLEGTREKLKKLRYYIRRQMVVITGLTVAGLIIAYTIGIPILTVVFGVDLSSFKYELCVVMLGGGALAFATFYSTVITIIRLHRTLIVCYGAVALGAKLLSGFFVTNYGMMGAAALYAVLMTMTAIALFAITEIRIRKEWEKLND